MTPVKIAFGCEMASARAAFHAADYDRAFHHLERAHILGQRHLYRHGLSHWWMLRVGWRRRDGREVRGQTLRLFAVLPGFVFGWVPVGNTGGANVSAIKPMPIPADLEAILSERESTSKNVS